MTNLLNINEDKMKILTDMIYEELKRFSLERANNRANVNISDNINNLLNKKMESRSVLEIKPTFDGSEPEDFILSFLIGDRKAICHLRNLPENDANIRNTIANALSRPSDKLFWEESKKRHKNLIKYIEEFGK